MRRLAVDRTPFQGQIVNCLCCLSQYLAENTVFLSDNVSNGEAVQLYSILSRKCFFLFDFYESLLVKKITDMKFDENPSRESRGSLGLRVSAQSRYFKERLCNAHCRLTISGHWMQPATITASYTSCSTGSIGLVARLSMSEFVLQNRIWMRL
jgi:hypothetical protein